MRDKRVYEIAVISVFVALIIVFTMIPMVGYIQIGIVALTTMHIPVLIGGTFGGRKVAYTLGLVFGLSSFAYSFMAPTGINVAFQNPLVSVLPRVLFGLALYEIYGLSKKYISNKYLAISVHMVVSTVFHTIVVVLALVIFAESTLAINALPVEVLPLFIGLIPCKWSF